MEKLESLRVILLLFILIEQKINLNKWNKINEKVCRNKDFCGIVIPSKKDNISEFNQPDIESVIKKIDGSANNPEHSSTAKTGEHIPCGYSMSTKWVFDNIVKKSYLISWRRLYAKVLYFFKGTRKK